MTDLFKYTRGIPTLRREKRRGTGLLTDSNDQNTRTNDH